MEAILTENLTKCYGKARGITNLNLVSLAELVLSVYDLTARANPQPFARCWG